MSFFTQTLNGQTSATAKKPSPPNARPLVLSPFNENAQTLSPPLCVLSARIKSLRGQGQCRDPFPKQDSLCLPHRRQTLAHTRFYILLPTIFSLQPLYEWSINHVYIKCPRIYCGVVRNRWRCTNTSGKRVRVRSTIKMDDKILIKRQQEDDFVSLAGSETFITLFGSL